MSSICRARYAIQFPPFSKISVRGHDEHRLYRYLTEESPFRDGMRWDFQTYLVGRRGRVIGRYRPSQVALDGEIVQDIERALARPAAGGASPPVAGLSTIP